jgi:hypothetical protein
MLRNYHSREYLEYNGPMIRINQNIFIPFDLVPPEVGAVGRLPG